MRRDSRCAFLRLASSWVLPLSGSQCPREDTAVLITSIGVTALGNILSIIVVSTGRDMEPVNPARKTLNSVILGRHPYQSRYATSSKVLCSASSVASYPRYTRRPFSPSIKQISELQATTSARPASDWIGPSFLRDIFSIFFALFKFYRSRSERISTGYGLSFALPALHATIAQLSKVMQISGLGREKLQDHHLGQRFYKLLSEAVGIRPLHRDQQDVAFLQP